MIDQMGQRTYTNFKFKKNSNSKRKSNMKLPTIDTAYLTFYDYERIKKNSIVPTKDELLNNERVQKEQENTQLVKAHALKEKIKNYDINQPRTKLININRENVKSESNLLSVAQKILDQNEDCVKDMEKLALFAKVASIRERQLKEHEMMEQMYKKKEEKLDTMMELERLKELKHQQDREFDRKKKQRDGCLIIIDQIKQKEYEKIKKREIIEKEKQIILRQIKELADEDIRQNERKRIANEQAAKEIVESNRINALNKQKKLLEEKEEDLKILKYNLEKAKKEEEELKEKKRIQEEKEREIQRLREKQEKAIDKQAEMDALMAERAYEQSEREIRIKEQNELLKKKKKIEELIASNERQRLYKQNQLAEQAKQEHEEHERIVKQYLEETEKERRAEEDKKKKLYENTQDLKKLIKIKEEKERMHSKEKLEDGRKMKQNADDWYRRMEKIKREKIQDLKNLGVQPKYIADLERYKIV
jgi:hypothetical protein